MVSQSLFDWLSSNTRKPTKEGQGKMRTNARKFRVALTLLTLVALVVAVFGAVSSQAANPTTIASSTMVFEGELTDEGGGIYSGVLAMVDGAGETAAGLGDGVGGYDVYARNGATAWFGDDPGGGPVWTSVAIASHDAWPTGDPDTPDWYQYSLNLYEDSGEYKWAVRNHPGATAANPWYDEVYWGPGGKPACGVPMSGAMDWTDMYGFETDVGAYLPTCGGTPEIPGGAASKGGGPAYWDMDWSWGSEAVPLEYGGFDVDIDNLGDGQYRVTLTPQEPQSDTPGAWIIYPPSDGRPDHWAGNDRTSVGSTSNWDTSIDHALGYAPGDLVCNDGATGPACTKLCQQACEAQSYSPPPAGSIIELRGPGVWDIYGTSDDCGVSCAWGKLMGITIIQDDVTIRGQDHSGQQQDVFLHQGSATTPLFWVEAEDVTIENLHVRGEWPTYLGGYVFTTAERYGYPDFMLGTDPHATGLTVEGCTLNNVRALFDQTLTWESLTFTDNTATDVYYNIFKQGVYFAGDNTITDNTFNHVGEGKSYPALQILNNTGTACIDNNTFDSWASGQYAIKGDAALSAAISLGPNNTFVDQTGGSGAGYELYLLSTGYAVGASSSADIVQVSGCGTPPPTEVWVDDNYDEASCTAAGHTWQYDCFDNIQDGVDAVAGSIVHVGPGTYVEQVEITTDLTLQGAGSGTVIQSPDTLTKKYTTSADNYPIVYVHDAHDVTIQDLVVDGAGKGNANYRFQGIGYHNAGGTVDSVEIKDVRDTPFSGAQHGVALYVYNEDDTSRSITVSNCNIHDFQKNAMALNANATTPLAVDVHGNQVTGYGATDVTAQNGIQVWADQGTGSVADNTVTGIAYDNTNASTKWVATSILNYYADLDITGNSVSNGHVGIYNIDGDGQINSNNITIEKVGVYAFGIVASDPPEAVPSPFGEDGVASKALGGAKLQAATTLNVTVSGNTVTFSGCDNTDTFGIEADAGYGPNDMDFSAQNNAVTGFDVGIEIYKCESDCDTGVFTSVKANHNNISGNTIGLRSNVSDVTVDAENNYWGDVDGPEDTADDAGETTEVPPCSGNPASEKNTAAPDGSLGDKVDDTSTAVVDYCPWSLMSYWKPDYPDYAPSGMPDFDQKQDAWQKDGKWTYCGPVAVANCLWWFDSKFETNTTPPPAIFDNYPLLTAYDAWDDHAPQNVVPFVGDLAGRMGTDVGIVGTDVTDMEAAIDEYLFDKGLDLNFYEHTQSMPTFEWVEKEVERSEDVILLLGFYWCDGTYIPEEPYPGNCSGQWHRSGGHYVTVAGVNSEEGWIAFSDPFRDNAEAGGPGRVRNGSIIGHTPPHSGDPTQHNDAGNVSHDAYQVMFDSPSPGGEWGLVGYADSAMAVDFAGVNPHPSPPVSELEYVSGPLFTEVEYAVVISPKPILWVDPDDGSVRYSIDDITIDVKMTANGMYGVEFDLDFDDTLLQVVDADTVKAGTQISVGSMWPGTEGTNYTVVQNKVEGGTIEFAVYLLDPEPELDIYDGQVAQIEFHGTNPGVSALDLNDAVVGTKEGESIEPVFLQDGTLTVLCHGCVHGIVEVQGRNGPPKDWDGAQVTVSDGPGGVYSYNTTVTNLDGSWSMCGVVAGDYDIAVEMARYLDGLKVDQTITDGGDLDVGQVKVLGGDCNEDDTVNILDATILGAVFGNSPPVDVRADINDDGTVNILDAVLLGGNWHKSSPVPWS
jgi:hypothetical protein